MVTEKTIIEAYKFLRENNSSIPDETIDFMLRASIKEYAALSEEFRERMKNVPGNSLIAISVREAVQQNNMETLRNELKVAYKENPKLVTKGLGFNPRKYL